jgi:hypothetical protein
VECGELDVTNLENYYPPEFKIKIYPNPVNDLLNLEILPNKPNVGKLKIYDFTGKLVLNIKIENQNEIDVTDLPVGVYLLSIIVDKSIISKKFLIQ